MSKRIHLVLVPGLLSTEEVWGAQIEMLKEFCDVRVTLQNLHHDTLEAMAEGILAESPPQFAIAGSSMGGYIATVVEKIGGPRVTHLCLIGGIINPQSDIQRKVYRQLLEYAERGEFEAIKKDLPSMFLNADNQANVSMVKQVYDMAETVGLERFLQQLKGLASGKSLIEESGKIGCPTLVIHGAQDFFTPSTIYQEFSTSIPNSQLIELEGGANMLPLERPETLSELMTQWMMGSLTESGNVVLD